MKGKTLKQMMALFLEVNAKDALAVEAFLTQFSVWIKAFSLPLVRQILMSINDPELSFEQKRKKLALYYFSQNLNDFVEPYLELSEEVPGRNATMESKVLNLLFDSNVFSGGPQFLIWNRIRHYILKSSNNIDKSFFREKVRKFLGHPSFGKRNPILKKILLDCYRALLPVEERAAFERDNARLTYDVLIAIFNGIFNAFFWWKKRKDHRLSEDEKEGLLFGIAELFASSLKMENLYNSLFQITKDSLLALGDFFLKKPSQTGVDEGRALFQAIFLVEDKVLPFIQNHFISIQELIWKKYVEQFLSDTSPSVQKFNFSIYPDSVKCTVIFGDEKQIQTQQKEVELEPIIEVPEKTPEPSFIIENPEKEPEKPIDIEVPKKISENKRGPVFVETAPPLKKQSKEEQLMDKLGLLLKEAPSMKKNDIVDCLNQARSLGKKALCWDAMKRSISQKALQPDVQEKEQKALLEILDTRYYLGFRAKVANFFGRHTGTYKQTQKDIVKMQKKI